MRLAGCRATPQWKCDTFEIISVLASTATTNITKKQHKNQTALKRNGEKSKMMSSSTEFIHSIRFYSCFCGRRRQLHACAMCGVYTISSTSVLPFRVHIFNIIFFLSRISFAAFKLYVCSTFIPVFRSTMFHFLSRFFVYLHFMVFSHTTVVFTCTTTSPPLPFMLYAPFIWICLHFHFNRGHISSIPSTTNARFTIQNFENELSLPIRNIVIQFPFPPSQRVQSAIDTRTTKSASRDENRYATNYPICGICAPTLLRLAALYIITYLQ